MECNLIGNSYSDRNPYFGKNIFEVYSACKDFVKLKLGFDAIQKVEIDEVEPIVLTKEWLLKFEFIESNELFVYKRDNFQVFIYPNFSDDHFHFSINKWCCVNIWYVHQLQNLIYTLFGVELQLTAP